MSPRSEEYLESARARLAMLDDASPADHPVGAIGLAYYAMLNAARAALSERDRNARTHRGTWHLLHEEFVATGQLDEALVNEAQRVQSTREAADYDAEQISPEDAEAAVAHARRFVAAIEDLIG